MASLDFTKPKFLSLSSCGQHKQCAALLRRLYDLLALRSPRSREIFEQYNQWRTWMSLDAIDILSTEAISNCNQMHLEQANITLREHDFLPQINKNDRAIGEQIWPIAIFLDNLRSAHNVGSILRTVEAFSLGKVIFSGTTPDVNHFQVKTTSMGTSQWIEWESNVSLKSLPQPVIALETAEDADLIHEFLFPKTFTLVVGNEEYGCSKETLQHADCCIKIPVRGRKNSLNVANAFAIAAAEIQRQRMNHYEKE